MKKIYEVGIYTDKWFGPEMEDGELCKYLGLFGSHDVAQRAVAKIASFFMTTFESPVGGIVTIGDKDVEIFQRWGCDCHIIDKNWTPERRYNTFEPETYGLFRHLQDCRRGEHVAISIDEINVKDTI